METDDWLWPLLKSTSSTQSFEGLKGCFIFLSTSTGELERYKVPPDVSVMQF